MTRKVSAEVDLVHQQTQNQRYGSSHIGATAKDISNVVTDAASGVVDIFHGIDKAVADTWNNFWKDYNLFNNLIQRNQSAAFSSGKVRPNHETNINIIARRTGKDVNSHTVLDGIITTIMATIQRINIIGSREGSRNRRRLKANQTGKKFRVGIKSNISTNRNNLISGVDRCIHLNAMKKTTITSINRQTIKI